jgi:hypothetical protein
LTGKNGSNRIFFPPAQAGKQPEEHKFHFRNAPDPGDPQQSLAK